MDQGKYSSLIATKLHVPTYGSDLLHRHQLVEEIDEVRTARVILICAPAGFGKTTAVSQWITSIGKPAGWLSLDEADNDPARFWRYFAKALSMAQREAGREASAMLDLTYAASADNLLSMLLEEIAAMPTDYYLVLDDYHLIKERSIHEGLQTLLQHASPFLHVILISREEPPLSLHRLRVRKQLGQLGAEHLRFNEEECRQLFNELLGLDLSYEDIHVLSKRTEGWIAGLQLAALSMQGKGGSTVTMHSFSGNDKYVEDYLTEEVLKRLPESVQQFLLKTSILPRLSGELCAAVASEPDAHAILEMLARTNSFVVPLDGVNEWYRYHHLFADLLHTHLRKTYSEQLPTLHVAASRWFEGHGWMTEAIDHALKGSDWSRATRLIVEHAPWMLKQHENVTLRRWMRRFDTVWLKSHPELCIAFAWMHALSDELEQAEALLHLAEDGLHGKNEGFEECRVEIWVLRGYVQLILRNIALSLSYLEESVKMKPKFSRYFIVGIELNGDEAFVLRSRVALSGYLSKVSEFYPAIRTIWKHSGLGILAYGSIVMAELYYEKNEFEQLTYFVQRALQLGSNTMNFGVLVPAYLVLTRWRKAEKRGAEMWLPLAEIAELCRQRKAPPHWIAFLDAFRVRLLLDENQREEAEQWASQFEKMSKDLIHSRHEFERLTLARVYLSAKRENEACELLTRLKHETEVKDRLGSRIETLILLSQAYHSQKRHHEAAECIRTAVMLAAPEGYVRIFLDEGPEVAKMLYALYKSKACSRQELDYMASLLKTVEKEFPALDIQIRVSPELDKLTEREAEVLSLIGEGLSNAEIAGRLHLTIGTVKVYVHQIYAKLQVRNRTQAVVKLRESEL
ncbi:LuxR C-terminal-related transcriptional regulator [Brevibacillus sp. HD1.4A]|uniref:LuxR C-terminal-related transcriptional regulator n=1 Tax=Brevibacillus sp. HD1.4A TaxID=2738978 RepID=UPI00156B9227|nr:LuxR C-terminal-related transcriptional regulator [Brevibacillus sp. HD1.4A]NRQ55971.1 transcriptional regulator [Brevibacillus sp. HD1.4A]